MATLIKDNGEITQLDDEKELEKSEDEKLADESIESVIASIGGGHDATVFVYRLLHNKPKSFVVSMPPADFSLEMLRDEYQGGSFQILVRKGGKLVKCRNISVESPPKKDMVSSKDDTKDLIFQMMRADQQRSHDLIVALLGKDKPDHKLDWPALLTAAAAMVPALKSLFSEKSNQVDTLLKGLELGQRFSDDKKETNMTDVVLKGFDAISTLIKPQQITGPEQKQLPASEQNMLGQEIFKQKLQPLVEAAKNNEDTTVYCDLIFIKVPPTFIKAWIIDQQNPLEKLTEIEPQIAQYNGWFAQLINDIRETWAENNAVNNDSEQ